MPGWITKIKRPGVRDEGPVSTMPTLDPGQEQMAELLRKMLSGVLSPQDYLTQMQSFLKGAGFGRGGGMPATPTLDIPAMPSTQPFQVPSMPSIPKFDVPYMPTPGKLDIGRMPETPAITAKTAGAGLLGEGGVGGPLGPEMMKALRDALSGRVSEEYFQKTVAGPATRTFREEIAPTLAEQFAGPGTFWGGARGEAVGREGMRLAEGIASARGQMSKEALDRQLQAALGYGEFQAGAGRERAQFMAQNYNTYMQARSQDYSTWAQATGQSHDSWLKARSQDYSTWAQTALGGYGTQVGAMMQGYGAQVGAAASGYSSWAQAKSQDYNTWAQLTGGAYNDWLDARSQDYNTWQQGRSQDLSTYMQSYIQANPTQSDTINAILQYLNIPTLAAYQNPEYMPGAIKKAMGGGGVDGGVWGASRGTPTGGAGGWR